MAGTQRSPGGPGGDGRRPPRRHRPLWRRVRWLRLFLFLVFLLGISGTVMAAGFMMGAVRAMGPITALRPDVAQTSFVYDRNGELLTEIQGPENRIVVPLEQIPIHVRQAFIAIEDERFYHHFGVDPVGIARAIWNNLRGGYLQGASTITQQLARSAFLTQDRTVQRKLQEAILAIELERRFTKDEILEMYLNQIYFGNGAYGIQAASYTYFGKPVEQLTIAEGAVLAGIPKNPSAYPPPPIPDPGEELNERQLQQLEEGRWRERQRLVLAKMKELGFITDEQYQQALAEDVMANRPKVNTRYPRREREIFGSAVDYVIEETLARLQETLMAENGLSAAEAEERANQLLHRGGLRIYTTIDPRLQQAAFEAQRRHLQALRYPMPTEDDRNRGPQVAAVLIDVPQAQIVAMVGGRTYWGSLGSRQLNRAVRKAQLGSAAKPLTVYAPALAHGLTAATVADDVQMRVGGELKQNYDGRYFGYTPFRFALKRSINMVALRAVQMVGIEEAWEMGRRLGLKNLTEEDKNLVSLALGAYHQGVTPLEVADAYATLARGGVREPAYAVAEIKDADGRVLYQHHSQKEAVLDEGVAYILADMMREVMEPHRFPTSSELFSPSTGTGYRVHSDYFRRPAAGKTGTHEDKHLWFVGFTPQYAAAVWVGYDEYEDGTKLPRGASGGSVPGPIWGRIMAAAHQGKPVRWFDPPRNIVTATVCANTGLLPGPYCPQELQYREIFVAGTQPTEAEGLWVNLPVCAENPQLAYSPQCACTPQEKPFFNRPAADLPAGASPPRDYAWRPPSDQGSCTASPGFQRDRAPNEIWLTPQGAVPGEMTLTGTPGATVTIRLTDVAGRDHAVNVPLPDRQIRVAAFQSVEVPLTLPAEPGQHQLRLTATSQSPEGGQTTLVVRLLVTVEGAQKPGGPGDREDGSGGEDNGGGPGNGQRPAPAEADVEAVLRPNRIQLRGGNARLRPGGVLNLHFRNEAEQDRQLTVVITRERDTAGEQQVTVPAGGTATAQLSFAEPGDYRITLRDAASNQTASFPLQVVGNSPGNDQGGEDEAGPQALRWPRGPAVVRLWPVWWPGGRAFGRPAA